MLRSEIAREQGSKRSATTAAAAVATLAFVAWAAVSFLFPAGHGGAEPAEAKQQGPCPYAHSGPREIDQSQAKESIVCLINKKRASHGVGGVAGNGSLDSAAQRHTDHMVGSGCFDHVCSGESGMTSRVKQTGYLNGVQSWGLGENIAAGSGSHASPASIVQAWMNSQPHRVTLLNPRFEHVGVGVDEGTPWKPHADGATYTTDFGYNHG